MVHTPLLQGKKLQVCGHHGQALSTWKARELLGGGKLFQNQVYPHHRLSQRNTRAERFTFPWHIFSCCRCIFLDLNHKIRERRISDKVQHYILSAFHTLFSKRKQKGCGMRGLQIWIELLLKCSPVLSRRVHHIVNQELLLTSSIFWTTLEKIDADS